MQAQVLDAGAEVTAPGGALVYSVCTISRAESDDMIAAFLTRHSDFELDDCSALLPAAADGGFLRTMPDRDGTDGFFIARLRRAGAGTPVRL